jgi:hypothetical protein
LRAALALLAYLDPEADPECRLDGALLVAMALDDLRLIRSVFTKRDGEE